LKQVYNKTETQLHNYIKSSNHW